VVTRLGEPRLALLPGAVPRRAERIVQPQPLHGEVLRGHSIWELPVRVCAKAQPVRRVLQGAMPQDLAMLPCRVWMSRRSEGEGMHNPKPSARRRQTPWRTGGNAQGAAQSAQLYIVLL